MSKEEDALKLPTEIKALEEKEYEDVKLSEEAHKTIDLATNELRAMIDLEKDVVTGKKTFSNPVAREAELAKRMGKNEDLQMLFQKQQEHRDHSKANVFELSYKLRMFSILKRLVDK